jgi:putative tricarboxylic transport membrane protein
MEKKQKIALLFLLVLSVFVSIKSWQLGLGRLSAPGSGFLPFGVSIFLILSVAFLFLKERKNVGQVVPLFRGKNVKNLIYGLGGLFAYWFLLNKLGFFTCTFLFVGFCLKMIEPHRWRLVIPVSIISAIISYLIFNLWLKIPIPEAEWVNKLFRFSFGGL